MSVCEHMRQLSAYHDGELSPDARSRVEAHLALCAVCRRELQELRALSRLLSESRVPGVAAACLERLHNRAVAASDRFVVIVARGLAAAAAAILIVCALWVWSGPRQHERLAARPAKWELAAVTLQMDTSVTEAGQMARWIAKDLSLENCDD